MRNLWKRPTLFTVVAAAATLMAWAGHWTGGGPHLW